MLRRCRFRILAVVVPVLLLVPARAADVAGAWNVKVNSPEGEHAATLTITQQDDKITGAFSSAQRGQHKVEGTIKGEEIQFTVRYTGGDQAMVIPFHGKLEGNRMSGRYQAGDTTGTWTAEKVK